MPGIPDIALGADEFLYASIEDIYGVWKRPVAGDGVRVREIGFGRSQERVTRDDKLGTRSHTERITRKKAVEFNFTSYIVPSGTFGVAPDVGNILKALFGAENVTGAGVEYTLVRDQNISLTLHRLGDNYSESLTGCVPNTATFRWSGTDEPVIEVSGFGKEWVITGEGEAGDLAVIAGTTLKVPNADNVVDINSIVAFVDGVSTYDNGGVGYRISAVVAGAFPSTTIVAGVNDDIDFDEGAGPLVATVAPATYTTAASLAIAVKTALEVAGGDIYTVSYDDTPYGTQRFTISSDGSVSLDINWASGPNTLTSIKADLGYTADDTGAFSYTADDPITDGLITTDEAGGWEAAFPEGTEIVPFFPTPTTQGSPVNSITGSMDIDNDISLRTTEGSVEYNGNMEARNDIFGEESSIGFSVSGRREVTMSTTSYLETDYVNLVKEFNEFGETHDILVTLGEGAGNLCLINMPSLEFDNVPFTVPEQEEATVVLTGMALDTAAPYEGEIKVTFA